MPANPAPGRPRLAAGGGLGATVTQACVVTLAPVITRIEETVTRRYLADMPEPEGEEVEMPEDDSAEPLPVIIDPGAVMIEALALWRCRSIPARQGRNWARAALPNPARNRSVTRPEALCRPCGSDLKKGR